VPESPASPPAPLWRRPAVWLFAAAALAYLAWRVPGDLVWDDSPTVCENLYARPGPPAVSFDDPRFWRSLWEQDFGSLHPDGYRPLSWVGRRIGMACQAASPRWAPAGFLALNAAVAGLLAAAAYRLARRFTRTDAAAVFSVFLLLASTPVLTGFLVLFVGIQALVPLAMCAALNCYFASAETGRRWPWLPLMALLLFVAPLYREFAGLTSLLILFLEMQRRRWRGATAATAAAAFAFALFPTALPRLLFFPDLPVAPVYQLGVLGEQAAKGTEPAASFAAWAWQATRSLKWRIFLDLFAILPPTLWLLAAAGWVAAGWRRAPAVPWRKAAFLGSFFLLTFLPFLKVFKEQVHLAYCLVPASIGLAASLEALWAAAAGRRAAAVAVAGLFLVGVADHALNPFVVRGATRDCYAAIDRVAVVCAREAPDGAVLLSNAHHAEDVRLHCGGRFGLLYTTMTSGDPARVVGDPAALDALRRRATAGVFCLDARLPRRRQQLGGDRAHWVIRDRPVPLREIGEIDRVSYRYPVLDPLKMLLPIRNVSWPGSPDLEFDYYHGPALDGTPWLREVAVSYFLYEVARDSPGEARSTPTRLFSGSSGE
jgi:hypothetical protein